MGSTQGVLSETERTDIHALARFITRHVDETWWSLLQKHHARLLESYQKVGDMAYGAYLEFLFRPIHQQLKQAGLRVEPKLPGDFDSSREWGNADESDQQRWMWSSIVATTGEALGTIVTITFHDHTQFRVPRQPQIIGLEATDKMAVVEALSQRSADFKQAREFVIEYEEYLRSQAEAEQQEGQAQ
jgi:hypothetical protein